MGNIIRQIFQNRSTRVLALLFVALFILIGYFLVHSYFIQLNIHKDKVLARLEAIAITASTQIDGNQLEYVLDTYTKKDVIKTNEQDKVYKNLHQILLGIKNQNNLKSELYTLTYDSTRENFYFGVSSSTKPFYKHEYTHFPKELLRGYKFGGKLDVYEDENGHWLSAFSPIKNTSGKVIAVVQVDSLFDVFLQEARSEINKNILISIIVIVVIIFLLIRSMRSILLTEDKLTADLIQSKLELEQKNQETLGSIIYAKKIQDSILPLQSIVEKELGESFIFFKPRDIVSGDFYWFKQLRDKVFIASVDCTGHGVPGAFMSMIGSILLDDIISKKEIDEPDQILFQLHKGIVKALKQNSREMASKDGMDIALCVIDRQSGKLKYAGAHRPLIFIRDGNLSRIKANSTSIGGYQIQKPDYTLHEIDTQRGDTFYIYSDGFPDQFGGPRGKKYMTKNFRDFLLKISVKTMSEQKNLIFEEFESWRGEESQVDDVLVIGFKL